MSLTFFANHIYRERYVDQAEQFIMVSYHRQQQQQQLQNSDNNFIMPPPLLDCASA